MSDDLLKYLSDRHQTEIEHLSSDLARGTAKDHGEYKYACGIIRGLMLATGFIAEVNERINDDEE